MTDHGVRYAHSREPLKKVERSPAPGEYSFDGDTYELHSAFGSILEVFYDPYDDGILAVTRIGPFAKAIVHYRVPTP